ncbi:hypothetical protein FKM82_022571 [Ascaphus truei]
MALPPSPLIPLTVTRHLALPPSPLIPLTVTHHWPATLSSISSDTSHGDTSPGSATLTSDTSHGDTSPGSATLTSDTSHGDTSPGSATLSSDTSHGDTSPGSATLTSDTSHGDTSPGSATLSSDTSHVGETDLGPSCPFPPPMGGSVGGLQVCHVSCGSGASPPPVCTIYILPLLFHVAELVKPMPRPHEEAAATELQSTTGGLTQAIITKEEGDSPPGRPPLAAISTSQPDSDQPLTPDPSREAADRQDGPGLWPDPPLLSRLPIVVEVNEEVVEPEGEQDGQCPPMGSGVITPGSLMQLLEDSIEC